MLWKMAKLSNLPGLKQGDCESEATWNSVPALCGKNSGTASSGLCAVITGTSRGQQQRASLMITPLLHPIPPSLRSPCHWYTYADISTLHCRVMTVTVGSTWWICDEITLPQSHIVVPNLYLSKLTYNKLIIIKTCIYKLLFL